MSIQSIPTQTIFVGTKAVFAVEVEIVAFSHQQIFFGFVQLWINGQSVGETDAITCVNSSMLQWEAFINFRGKRNIASLWYLDPDEVISIFNAVLYEPRTEEFVLCGNDQLDTKTIFPVQLAPNGTEPFDGWRVIVLEHNAHQKIIWGHEIEATQVLILEHGTIETVLQEFITQFETLMVNGINQTSASIEA